jgi:peptidoglycan/LPS O-acetylase OafA/YrhL
LITGLLIKQLDNNSFSLADFWLRRVRRIFPALAVMVIAVLLASYFVLIPRDLRELGATTIAHSLLVANVYFWRDSGYFAGPAELKPLLHTWSLAVEEQFYLLFPLVLLMMRRLTRQQMIGWLVLAFNVSLCLSMYGAYEFPDFTFYMLPTRAWELLAGSLLAMQPNRARLSRRQRECLGWTGLAGILGPMLVYDQNTVFPGLMAIVPVAGAVMVMASHGDQPSRVGKILSLRPLVFVGLISYSLYLWHWPLFVLTKHSLGELTIGLSVVVSITSVWLAWLSYRWVETPVRQGLWLSHSRQLMSAASLSAVTVIGIGTAYLFGNGFPYRYSAEQLAILSYLEPSESVDRFRACPEELIDQGRLPGLGATVPTSDRRLLLWGDSHAVTYSLAFDAGCREFGIAGYSAAVSGMPPVPRAWTLGNRGAMTAWNAAVEAFAYDHEITDVVLVCNWGALLGNGRQWLNNETSRRRCAAESIAVVEAELVGLAERLAGKNIRLWVCRQVPRQPVEVPTYLVRHTDSPNASLAGVSREAHRSSQREQLLDRLAQSHENMRVVALDSAFYDASERTRVAERGIPFYRDSNHLTQPGVTALLTSDIRALLRTITPSPRDP